MCSTVLGLIQILFQLIILSAYKKIFLNDNKNVDVQRFSDSSTAALWIALITFRFEFCNIELDFVLYSIRHLY